MGVGSSTLTLLPLRLPPHWGWVSTRATPEDAGCRRGREASIGLGPIGEISGSLHSLGNRAGD